MTTALPALAFVDWGVGGFGVVRELFAHAPRASYTYLSDSGFLPYGKVPRGALAARVGAVLHYLAARGVERVVVACNAASTALPDVSAPPGLSVVDVIGAGVALVRAAKVARVGLVGGRRTVLSRAHATALARHRIDVRARIAQPLSAFVEAGQLDGAEVRAAVHAAASPLRALPAVLLACTHYPALMPHFRATLPGVRLLDPAALAVREALRGAPPREGPAVVLTTGDAAATARSARLAFGVRVRPRTIDL